uniref:Uncharacterized protein n=1 Tax=Molossus molossus TaxID=27622 RepID=A0A7J8GQT2_MOLMO|nr:hypothetical protein HJG59_011308 [Molossus molossus]
MFSRFIHVVAYVRMYCFYNANNIPLHVYNTFCLLICQWTQVVHLSTSVNSTAMNMDVELAVRVFTLEKKQFLLSIFLGYIPRGEIAGSYDSSMFNLFQKPPHGFPHWLHQYTFPPAIHSVPCLHILASICYFLFLFLS